MTDDDGKRPGTRTETHLPVGLTPHSTWPDALERNKEVKWGFGVPKKFTEMPQTPAARRTGTGACNSPVTQQMHVSGGSQ